MTTPGLAPRHQVDRHDGRHDHSDLRRAWTSLALLPVGFVLSMLLGEGLLALQGYGGDSRAPLWPTAVAAVPALAVLLASPAAAVRFGERARRSGELDGRTDPALVGLVVGTVLLAMNVVPLLLGR